MDVADFLQEVPTADGRRFTEGNTTSSGAAPPVGTAALVQAWKESELYHAMVEEMDNEAKQSTGDWPAVYREYYPGKPWFNFTQCLRREAKLTIRNTAFLRGRAMQSLVVGGIAGSLFSDLAVEDYNTMSGILFFAALFGALSAMSMIPIIYAQRAVFYKHSRSLFFPTPAYVLAQTVVMYPLQIFETIVFTSIVYWAVGLTADVNGSRYFTFMFVVFVFSLCVSQYFRLVASMIATAVIAQTVAGVSVVMMVLFSGFIIPKSNIPPGWVWFYWINPIAYVLRSVTVNEFLASDYDFPVCLNVACTVTRRFGDLVLDSRGNPTDQVWVWYGVAVLVGLYLLFLVLTTLALSYLRLEPVPPPPVPTVEHRPDEAEKPVLEIPFDPVSFSFRDIWYTVKVGNGGKKDELDLLKGVSGYFEPGTVTALVSSFSTLRPTDRFACLVTTLPSCRWGPPALARPRCWTC
jgi:ABC-type polysaccharide/polyol phosphate export permease